MKRMNSFYFVLIVSLKWASGSVLEKNYPKNCLHPSITQNGYYFINPGQDDPILVHCENGWTTVLNKIEYKSIGTTNPNYNKDFFAKPWPDYLNGFGSADTNFWIGLATLRYMVQNEEMKLRIEANVVGQRKMLLFIEYDSFYIDAASKQFRLKIGKKTSGNLTDDFESMNGYKFYTQDNDTNGCAYQFRGGWWFHNCFHVCLTCTPPPTSASTNWYNNGEWITFSKSKMMLKPAKVLQRPANCFEIYKSDNFARTDGAYFIYPDPDSELAVKAYCEMNRGGWTRILNRINKSPTSFDQNWTDYNDGFGELNFNYWMGLSNIQMLTSKRKMSLRIEMWNSKSDRQFIEYDSFLVFPENEDFKLEVGKSTRGTVVDWMHPMHNSYRFFTKDRDNMPKNAATFKGGWWFGLVNKACLTCTQGDIETWSLNGERTIIFRFVKMMLKPTGD